MVHEITAAGGSFREDGGRRCYSGGLTLDHEDPSRVYLSRQVGPGAWQVETWTTADDGATWTSRRSRRGGKNVRPVSPRGMAATGGDKSVIWMNGGYWSYEAYDTAHPRPHADRGQRAPDRRRRAEGQERARRSR